MLVIHLLDRNLLEMRFLMAIVIGIWVPTSQLSVSMYCDGETGLYFLSMA